MLIGTDGGTYVTYDRGANWDHFNHMAIGPDAALSWDWVGYSFAICAGIGVVSGVYPATQAAYKNVLEALRYE